MSRPSAKCFPTAPILARAVAACAVICGAPTAEAGADQWCATPAPIADASVTAFVIEVPPAAEIRTIVGVRARIGATHPWVGDLSLVLRHPSGLEVVLVDRPGMPSVGFPGPWGCGGDGVDAWFDDASTIAAETRCPLGVVPVLGGELRPSGQLASLRGRAPQGAWTIIVRDEVAGDVGSLLAACIELDTAPDCNGNGVADSVDIGSGASADADGDGVPDECGCVADLNGDGAVNGADLAQLLGAWGACSGCGADLTRDGQVAGDDLAIILSSWGACGPS
jgi:subtilisin-like proprotein convertase family protein